jgi:outer membrane lipopolysaccharide assembly protein LptE/RlpB
MKRIEWMVMGALCLVLAGCGNGLDKSPDLTSFEVYKIKINQDFAEASRKKSRP